MERLMLDKHGIIDGPGCDHDIEAFIDPLPESVQFLDGCRKIRVTHQEIIPRSMEHAGTNRTALPLIDWEFHELDEAVLRTVFTANISSVVRTPIIHYKYFESIRLLFQILDNCIERFRNSRFFIVCRNDYRKMWSGGFVVFQFTSTLTGQNWPEGIDNIRT